MNLFNEIIIEEILKEGFEFENDNMEVKKLNIFIGENNSSKSRFMRELIKLKQIKDTETKFINEKPDIREESIKLAENIYNFIKGAHSL